MRRRLLALTLWLGGCSLHASNNDAGGALNLAADGARVYAALGTGGLLVLDAASGATIERLPPPGDSDSIDDVSAADGLLATLDADDGALSIYALSGDAPRLVAGPVEVPVGPYSGVALGGGAVVVSGGTDAVTVRSVAADGSLGPDRRLEAFRGQPDVGRPPRPGLAVLSTHFSGDPDAFVDGAEFGLSVLELAGPSIVATAGLPGAGFTAGGGRPASRPARVGFDAERVWAAHGGGLTSLRLDAEGGLSDRREHPGLGPSVDVAPAGDAAIVAVAEPPSLVAVGLSTGAPALRTLRALETPATAVLVVGRRLFFARPHDGVEGGVEHLSLDP